MLHPALKSALSEFPNRDDGKLSRHGRADHREGGGDIPSDGFVVNVEIPAKDVFENDGVFKPEDIAAILQTCQRYLNAPHAVMMFIARTRRGLRTEVEVPPMRRRAVSAPGSDRPRHSLLL